MHCYSHSLPYHGRTDVETTQWMEARDIGPVYLEVGVVILTGITVESQIEA